MPQDTRRRLALLGVLVAVFAVLAAVAVLLAPADQFAPPGGEAPAVPGTMPVWQLALINGAILFVAYGLLGLAGVWLAGKLQLPVVYRLAAGWRAWLLWPLLIGLALGLALIIGDQVFVRLGAGPGFLIPPFLCR